MGGSVSRVLTMLYFSTLWYHHTILISRNVSSYTVVKSIHTTATAKSLQSCPTLCDPIDGSPPGSVIPGILQARTLEWVAIFFSNAWKWKVKVKSLSRVWLLATPWTAAYQAPLAMGFSRQEYWSGVPLPNVSWADWLKCNPAELDLLFPAGWSLSTQLRNLSSLTPNHRSLTILY